MTYKQAYRYGLITQLSNPKIAVVLASVFTALLPKEIPNYYYVALPVICFMIDAGGIHVLQCCYLQRSQEQCT